MALYRTKANTPLWLSHQETFRAGLKMTSWVRAPWRWRWVRVNIEAVVKSWSMSIRSNSPWRLVTLCRVYFPRFQVSLWPASTEIRR